MLDGNNLGLPLADTGDEPNQAAFHPNPNLLNTKPVYRRHHKRKSSTIYVPPRQLNEDSHTRKEDNDHVQLIRGATSFAGAQLIAKVATFVSNQFLLRYLSSSDLGAGSQVDLMTGSILSISREGIRLSSQRRDVSKFAQKTRYSSHGKAGYDTRVGLLQETVNLGWLAIVIGTIFTCIIALVFEIYGSWPLHAIVITSIACLVELATEPCFLIMQLNLQMGVRAQAEGLANIVKVLVTGLATVVFKMQPFTGFAYGQLAFAITVAVVYFGTCVPFSNLEGFNLTPQKVVMPRGAKYLNQETYKSVKEFMRQQIVKYFLTEGDRFAVGMMATLKEQGEYTLAVNYGSLIVRFALFPVEEALRSYFSRTPNMDTRCDVISGVMRGYSYLMILCSLFGSQLAGYILYTFLRIRNVDVAKVLTAYCWYIPILAWNGSLEAFIQSALSLKQVRNQSLSLALAGLTFIVLLYVFNSLFHLGSVGLVYAQIGASSVRLIWSSVKVTEYFGSSYWISASVPNKIVLLLSFGLSVVMYTFLYPINTFSSFAISSLIVLLAAASAAFCERKKLTVLFS